MYYSLANKIRKENEWKEYIYIYGKYDGFLFVNGMILYIRDSDNTSKFLELLEIFNTVVVCEINKQNQ